MNRDMLKKQVKAFCPSGLKRKSCSGSIWIQLVSISPCVINPSVYPCASAVHTPLQADASQALLLSAFAMDAPGSPRTRLTLSHGSNNCTCSLCPPGSAGALGELWTTNQLRSLQMGGSSTGEGSPRGWWVGVFSKVLYTFWSDLCNVLITSVFQTLPTPLSSTLL